jgi:hypothetical protein
MPKLQLCFLSQAFQCLVSSSCAEAAVFFFSLPSAIAAGICPTYGVCLSQMRTLRHIIVELAQMLQAFRRSPCAIAAGLFCMCFTCFLI